VKALGFALIAAAGNLAGAAALVRHERRSLALIEGCVAFGAGFMLAVAVLEMVPQAFAMGGSAASLYVFGGYLGVHLAQHVLVPHFHFGEETHRVSAAVGSLCAGRLRCTPSSMAWRIASGFARS
jgi:ZIP family zinc transporter/zinc and cadmium transporter